MKVSLKLAIFAALLCLMIGGAGCVRITFGAGPTAEAEVTAAPESAAAPTQTAKGVMTFVNDSDMDLTALYISMLSGHNSAPCAAFIAEGDAVRLRFRELGGLPGSEFYIDVSSAAGAYYYMEYARELNDGDVMRFCADESSPTGYCFRITGRDGRTDMIPAAVRYTHGGGSGISS